MTGCIHECERAIGVGIGAGNGEGGKGGAWMFHPYDRGSRKVDGR